MRDFELENFLERIEKNENNDYELLMDRGSDYGDEEESMDSIREIDFR